MYNPSSPGELLREFLRGITATRLAEHIGVVGATVSCVLNDWTGYNGPQHPIGRGSIAVFGSGRTYTKLILATGGGRRVGYSQIVTI
jgi:hypothetical protein